VHVLNRGTNASDPMISMNSTAFNTPIIYGQLSSICLIRFICSQPSPTSLASRVSLQDTAVSMSLFGARRSANVCLSSVLRVSSLITAICAPGCDHGSCFLPGECSCDDHFTGDLCDVCAFGWSGPDCAKGAIVTIILDIAYNDQAICREGCTYGTCALPDACDCNAGYEGATCTVRMSYALL
jgi:hypothetical protein